MRFLNIIVRHPHFSYVSAVEFSNGGRGDLEKLRVSSIMKCPLIQVIISAFKSSSFSPEIYR